MCDALHYLLDNTFIRFGLELYRQIVGIPMDTNCAPLVADLFLFCYERDFMLSLSDNGRYFILPVPNSVSGTCLCNILRHKVSQHNFHNIHLLNVDSKFRDTEYEVRSPQESPCISIDQIISGQK